MVGSKRLPSTQNKTYATQLRGLRSQAPSLLSKIPVPLVMAPRYHLHPLPHGARNELPPPARKMRNLKTHIVADPSGEHTIVTGKSP